MESLKTIIRTNFLHHFSKHQFVYIMSTHYSSQHNGRANIFGGGGGGQKVLFIVLIFFLNLYQ